MKKICALTVSLVCIAACTMGQSKVFKEINEEISSSMQPILQDGALVGYLMFTQLEKISEDSLSYKLTIMDENLNDLGTVNFREEQLGLEAVAFEQDVLCVAYFKSNILGKQFKNRKAYNEAAGNKKNIIMVQFLNLDGKIVKSNNIPVDVRTEGINTSGLKVTAMGKLKRGVQLKNVPQKGFAVFFSDDSDNPLYMFSTQGEERWKKNLSDEKAYLMLTTTDDIFMLTADSEAAYSVSSYSAADKTDHISRFKLKDKDGNKLTVLAFQNDPVTGRPFVAGSVISKKFKNSYYTGKGMSNGGYCGVYAMDFAGKNESDIKSSFSYWNDGSREPSISRKGRFEDNGMYLAYDKCMRDFNGNTYFVGSSVAKKVRWGSITMSTLLLPAIIISPIWLGSTGTHKYKIKDAAIAKLDAKGNFNFDNSIDCNNSQFFHGRMPISMYDAKRFFQVSNNETKANYVVVDDTKDIVIYNITQKKIARTISHKDGKSRINIYPAKEGHIMVSEYNKKEKYTRLSIEAL
jgi:hypothetical protein